MANILKNIIVEMRVNQWLKNLLIFFPLIFSGNLLRIDLVKESSMAFLLFSLVASGVYIINDLLDIQKDRLHETKRLRPIASGTLSKTSGAVLAIVFVVVGLVFSGVLFGRVMLLIVSSYFVLNVFYSFTLKNIPPLDILMVAIFYLVRPIVGAFAIGVAVTNWLVLTTFFAALYLVILKRRSELASIMETNVITRNNIDHYDEPILDKMSFMVLGMAIVSYAIYSSNFGGFFVLTTIPLVGLGLRAVLISKYKIKDFANPERFIYKDRVSLACFLIWLSFVITYHV